MKLIPLNNYALIEPEEETTTESGLILEENKEFIKRGVIVALSQEMEREHTIEVGDIVYYGQYSIDKITREGKEYCLIRDINIICKEG